MAGRSGAESAGAGRTGLGGDHPGQLGGGGAARSSGDGNVHHHQIGGELGPGGQQRPVGRHNERIAVEDQLVLAPDLVDVGDGTAGLGHPLVQHGQPLAGGARCCRARRSG